MDPIKELEELDVEWSMPKTCETISKALEEVECAGAERSLPLLEKIEKKIEEAEEFYWRPLDDAEIYTRLVKVMEGVGYNDKCQKYTCKLKEMEANDWEFRGRLQNFFGNNTLAVKYYERALECNPDFEEAIAGLEKAEKRVAKADAEIEKAKRGIDKKPGLMKNYIALGQALADQGDLESALKEFERVLEKEPGNVDALCKKGAIMESRGDFEGAVPLFKKAQETKPNSLSAKRGLNYAEYFLEHMDEFYVEPEGN